MSADNSGEKAVFRHGTSGRHPRLALGILLGLVFAMRVLGVFIRHWLFLVTLFVVATSLYAYLGYVKFEIWESGFSHRDLSGNHVFEFAQIDDAIFETASVGEGFPAPVFSVRLKGEVDRKKVPIGMFPVRATALLFAALERYGIQIREDGSRLVQNTMRQIREAELADSSQ